MTEENCLCSSSEEIQRHHIFRKRFRKMLKKLSVTEIKVYYEGKGNNEVSVIIPIDSYTYFCEFCHKLNHPENINYHLNEVVVETLIQKKLFNRYNTEEIEDENK